MVSYIFQHEYAICTSNICQFIISFIQITYWFWLLNLLHENYNFPHDSVWKPLLSLCSHSSSFIILRFQNLSTTYSLPIHHALEALCNVSPPYLRQYSQLGNQRLYMFLGFYSCSHRFSIFCQNRLFWFFLEHWLPVSVSFFHFFPVSLFFFLPSILTSTSSVLLFLLPQLNVISGTLDCHSPFFCYSSLSSLLMCVSCSPNQAMFLWELTIFYYNYVSYSLLLKEYKWFSSFTENANLAFFPQ